MRLFVAIELPEALRRRLWKEIAPLRAVDAPVRWVGPERLHLTLKFIGDVAGEREPALTGAVADVAARHPPVPVLLRGTGAFPTSRRPRVLWVGVEPRPPLLELQSDLERTLAEEGVEPEDREYHPHVTLGRVRRGVSGEALRSLAAALEELAPRADHEAEAVQLMESRLHPDGARYTARDVHRLVGGRGGGSSEPEGEEGGV